MGSGMVDPDTISRRGTISTPIGRRRSSSARRSRVGSPRHSPIHSLPSLSLLHLHSLTHSMTHTQTTRPVLVKEYSNHSLSSSHHISFTPMSNGRSTPASQNSRGSNSSPLHCSLVAMEIDALGTQPEDDDSAFCSPHVPLSLENNTEEETMVSTTYS